MDRIVKGAAETPPQEYRLVILGRLDGLNEYTAECRRNAYAGAKMKARNENFVRCLIRHQLNGLHIKRPVTIVYRWYEKNRRRDLDNIAFAKKFINDALVKDKVLEDDNWAHVTGYSDEFYVDPENPRIEVILTEE